MPRRTLIIFLLVCAAPITAAFMRRPDPPHAPKALARELLKELIEIDTTDASGDTTRAAEAMAERLLDAGFAEEDVRVLAPAERKGNLVARYRGSGRGAPVLMLAHLDVVEAHAPDWSVDPFTFLERDGYFYGRGSFDDKAMAAIWIANFILMKQEGYVPSRDLVVALTADEEGGEHNGVQWLLANHRASLEAAFALNEGGGGLMKRGERFANTVQLSEKMYQSFQLEARSRGGHSSIPRGDNAIYQLAAALTRIAALDFDVQLDGVTRAYFARMATLESGQRAADMRAIADGAGAESAARRLSHSPYLNALLRTTCVATELTAGHAENALPHAARATVNCRLLPGTDVASVLKRLRRTVRDPSITVTPIQEAVSSPPSPWSPEVMGAIERVSKAMWPGVPVVPTMSTGATDGLYLRNAGIPTYGVSGIFHDVQDVRAHGRDERIGVQSFYEGREFLDRLTRELTR